MAENIQTNVVYTVTEYLLFPELVSNGRVWPRLGDGVSVKL